MSYHTNVTLASKARKEVDRQSILSLASDKKSVAPSLILHDFNGKKAKIIQTLKQIDDMKSGVVKSVVFRNLLSCLDVELEEADFAECQKKLGLSY